MQLHSIDLCTVCICTYLIQLIEVQDYKQAELQRPVDFTTSFVGLRPHAEQSDRRKEEES